jgi:hypothetical protein
LVTLLAHQSAIDATLPVRQAAWYTKPLPTFSDALAIVRQSLWRLPDFHASLPDDDMVKIPYLLLKRLRRRCVTQPDTVKWIKSS